MNDRPSSAETSFSDGFRVGIAVSCVIVFIVGLVVRLLN